ncbi:2-hydroxyacyl-CoA dehydratase subunit D, partial [Chloroflexota bacterium]
TPFTHILTVPRRQTEDAHELYEEEVVNLKLCLERFFEAGITDKALYNAIGVYNETRRLLKELYQLRKSDTPPISGAETMEVLNAMSKVPREQFNEILGRLVDEVGRVNRAVEGKFRLMIVGSPLNNIEFIRTIEDLGGLVVTDELCTGARYFWDLVETAPDQNPIQAISRRYLNNQPCARMVPSESRWNAILDMVEDFRVQGVVSEIIRHCVVYAHDQPLLAEKLANKGIPLLHLDLEYGTSGTGQIMTRVQAFIEMLEARTEK